MATLFVDVSGLAQLSGGAIVHGGYDELWAESQGLPPPVNLYRPRVGNVAPRTDSWAPGRSNTQTPPRSGPHKDRKAAQQQPRAPLCPEIKKLLP